jgi:hypothetical protein
MKRLLIFMVCMLVLYGAMAQNTLQKIEYFFNGPDPGVGNATKINLNSAIGLNNFPVRFSASGLSPGTHKLYFRVQDSNKWWSQTQRMDVLLQSSSSDSLVAIQYFFGEDPGVGILAGTQLQVNPQSAQIKNYLVEIENIPNGYANGYVRVKSANGNWSQTIRNIFQKTSIPNNKILALEYFFKSSISADSGVGLFLNRRYFSNPAEVITNQDIYIRRALPTAFDSLFLRVQDSYGLWSQTYRKGGNYQSAPVVSNLDLLANISNLEVFPNPFIQETTLRFELPKASPIELQVKDLAGREVFHIPQPLRFSEGLQKFTLPTSQLKAGVYFCELRYGQNSYVVKLVKE